MFLGINKLDNLQKLNFNITFDLGYNIYEKILNILKNISHFYYLFFIDKNTIFFLILIIYTALILKNYFNIQNHFFFLK